MPSRFLPSLSFPIVLIAVLAGAVAASEPSRSGFGSVPDPDAPDTAIFAGGSFWCLEQAFESLPGVDSVTSGYTGGHGPHPDFESVSEGNSSYVEAVRVVFRPKRIGYGELVDAFWKNIDPTRDDGQFTDSGPQYRTLIFYRDETQRTAAEASRKRLDKSKRFSKPIVTGMVPATAFHAAEPEHQDYYKRNAPRYRVYYRLSGREAFMRKVWGGNGAYKPKSAK